MQGHGTNMHRGALYLEQTNRSAVSRYYASATLFDGCFRTLVAANHFKCCRFFKSIPLREDKPVKVLDLSYQPDPQLLHRTGFLFAYLLPTWPLSVVTSWTVCSPAFLVKDSVSYYECHIPALQASFFRPVFFVFLVIRTFCA